MAQARVSITYFYHNITKQPTTKRSSLKNVNKVTFIYLAQESCGLDRVGLLAWARFGGF